MAKSEVFVGVDIGGTFTDIAVIRSASAPLSIKVPTTHDDYCRGVIHGIHVALGQLEGSDWSIDRVVHATTLGSNALLEGTGARVGLLTTAGFRDLLEIGRLRRPTLYDVFYRKPPPLIPRQHRLEVRERIAANGEVLMAPDLAEIESAAACLVESGVTAVAICFINSYVNPENENIARDIVKSRYPSIHVITSTDVLREIREYERFSTTAVNAYLAPVFRNYLGRLTDKLKTMQVAAPLLMMHSSGGLVSAKTAAEQPVRIIESGPAAGVKGAARLCQELGIDQAIALDMGGTTAKATVISDGRPQESYEYEVGPGLHKGSRLFGGNGYVVRVPAVDIAEIGAGGGSIAWVDALGVIHVGPRSAGSNPGPACYGLGGMEPTVTDANVVLGYLSSGHIAGGTIEVSRDKAIEALKTLAQQPSEASIVHAAYMVHAVAISNMIRAIRAVTTENGLDPAHFTLISFGGSGPIHTVGVAEQLGVMQVLVPPMAGIYSALGLISADIKYDEVGTLLRRLSEITAEELQIACDKAMARVVERIVSDGVDPASIQLRVLADVRFVGQSSELTIPLPSDTADAVLQALAIAFLDRYAEVYGSHGNHDDIELVNIRVSAEVALVPGFSFTGIAERMRMKPHGAYGERRIYFGPEIGYQSTPLYRNRFDIGSTDLVGPIVISEPDTTILVRPGDTVGLDPSGSVRINICPRGAV